MNDTSPKPRTPEQDADTRKPCPACGSLHPNPECAQCVAKQVAREVALYGLDREED